ncbi:gephyrin-like molybdotransferase Glp [Chitinimonas sp.]|uniref:molybdopterin molybdotransferase MoeA n=1 Tax=Chitinimonas sp. TaxID=1934313 RepID=UPI002F957E17
MSLLSFDEALARLLDQAQPHAPLETLPLAHCDGRVLAEHVVAPLAVPGFDNSAMDGYALHVADFAKLPAQWPITQRIAAGEVGEPLAPGMAARIFTGAPVPPGCNVVVPQEETEANDNQLRLLADIKEGQHIRRLGEDIALGCEVLTAGTRLGPPHLALAASLGIARLKVRASLRVGVLCTGDELTPPGEPLPPGGIYNSNQFAIGALLRRLGCVVSDYGKVADTREDTVAALRLASHENDVVISCGGVSVGEEDHVKAAVGELGRLDLWRIAIKPGKPLAFGKVGTADFIGLPGNPVSAFLTFVLLARPFLLKRMGAVVVQPSRLPLPAGFDWPRADKRREFLRARLEQNSTGQTQVSLYPSQGSAVMSGLAWADGLVDLFPGTTVKAGDTVHYLPLAQLLD